MGIDLRDYSRTGAQRGWGAGWPSCGGAKAAGTAVVTADRSGTRFSVHKRIARLADLIVDECERRGYLLKSGQTGGYNCRAIGGTSSPSNHSWGLAIDVNWATNPMRRPLTTDIPAWVVALFNRYGFAWGGHYSSTPDAMHFEFMGTPQQADAMTVLALRELTTTAKPEDSMPTVNDLLDAPIERAGPGSGGVTTLRAVAAWSDSNLRQLRTDVAADVRDLLAAPTDGPPALTAADHDAIARRVIALLTEHPLAPKGT